MNEATYTRHSQTLCTLCRRRAQWNGKRWIHLVIYWHDMHQAAPDHDLIQDSSDPWVSEKLRLMESGEAR
jgi:hypothetical protein